MDEAIVKKVAQELYSSGDTVFSKTFTIPDSEDVIVVVAVRTTKRGEESIKKLSESIIRKAVAGPSGQPCPLCGGTGKM